MSLGYQAVQWNRQKKIYDAVMSGGILLFLLIFCIGGAILHPNTTIETILIRGFGTAALLILHVILSIGPLCRLDRRFLPLLYNRRHLGVTMFFLALAHGIFSVIQFHTLGNLHPLVSVLVGHAGLTRFSDFPFQPLGLAGLLILFLMAATSHDFWLKNLTPPVWKALHMMVYIAYGLIIMHVVLGVLQAETSPVMAALLGIGVIWVLGLHLLAARKEKTEDQKVSELISNGYVKICAVDDIPEKSAVIATVSGERVAIFRYDGNISAISNVCQHQNGPLGEGRIIDGLVTCPWHGYQYRPHDGAAPPPFTEKVPTFNLKISKGWVWIDPIPNPPGTPVEPAKIV